MSLNNQRKVIRIGLDGSVTTYRLDDDDSVHPIVSVKADGRVVENFTKIAKSIASLLKGSLQVVIMPPEIANTRKARTRKKKKHAKMKARRRTT